MLRTAYVLAMRMVKEMRYYAILLGVIVIVLTFLLAWAWRSGNHKG
ncbi:MAG: hypothetical protein IMW91_00580 [Firmicutes bacterium]|nr:hypothetical protein [Bacillota bacterium]